MAQRIGGQGLTLPPPQNLYPSQLANTPADWSTNEISLAAGDVLTIPPGDWIIESGLYTSLQWNDPVTGIWRSIRPPRAGVKVIFSDGVNYRLANLTGCPVSATVAGGGTGFTQATITVTANVGGSTWQGVVGGSLSVISITNPGANYTMPPLVPIPHAPIGLGVNADATAALASGTVSAVTFGDIGAGYTTAPSPLVLLPNPADPNIGTITAATITIGLTNAGKVTAALCTNNGASLATISALTLTAAGGAGSGATITPNVLQVCTSVSVVAGGLGYVAGTEITSVGGTPVSTAVIANPTVDTSGFLPYPVIAGIGLSGTTVSSVTIYDKGVFLSTPTAIVINSGITTTVATVSFIMGGTVDTCVLQPAAG